MIDLHNHILHDWDDGPTTLAKSLEMARQAVSVGTTIMVATPHRYSSDGESLSYKVRKRVDELNSILMSENIPLKILAGVEIPIDSDVAEQVKSGALSTLGDGNYVLIEPPFPNLPGHLIPDIRKIFKSGLQAVLAHPERNSEVQKNWMQNADLSFVAACAAEGCVLQLTSGSIVGRFGPSALAVSRAIAMHREWNIVIASDSHDPKERTPGHLAQARDVIAAWISNPAAANAMVVDLPAQVIEKKAAS